MAEPVPALPFEVELDDGTRLCLRLGTPADRELLVAGFERLSPESRLTRFFTAMPRLAPQFLDRLLEVDRTRHVAVGAFDLDRSSAVPGSGDGFGVGVARYHADEHDPTRAEAAVAVIDEYHGRGIGRLLLDALVAHALENGIETFTAMVLTTNQSMLHIFGEMGATFDWDPDDRSVLQLEIPVTHEAYEHSHLHDLLRHTAERPGPAASEQVR